MGLLTYILINTLTLGYFSVKYREYRHKEKLRAQELHIKLYSCYLRAKDR